MFSQMFPWVFVFLASWSKLGKKKDDDRNEKLGNKWNKNDWAATEDKASEGLIYLINKIDVKSIKSHFLFESNSSLIC